MVMAFLIKKLLACTLCEEFRNGFVPWESKKKKKESPVSECYTSYFRQLMLLDYSPQIQQENRVWSKGG